MHTCHSHNGKQTDIELIAAARQDSFTAFGVLYDRHYQSALEFATELLGGTRGARELTAEAFGRVLARLLCGGGPTRNFHAYLRVTIHSMAADRAAGPAAPGGRQVIPMPRK